MAVAVTGKIKKMLAMPARADTPMTHSSKAMTMTSCNDVETMLTHAYMVDMVTVSTSLLMKFKMVPDANVARPCGDRRSVLRKRVVVRAERTCGSAGEHKNT